MPFYASKHFKLFKLFTFGLVQEYKVIPYDKYMSIMWSDWNVFNTYRTSIEQINSYQMVWFQMHLFQWQPIPDQYEPIALHILYQSATQSFPHLPAAITWGLFHKHFMRTWSNFWKKEITLLLLKNDDLIRSQFCTCHDSSAVMACANLWSDWMIRIIISAKRIWQDFNYGFIYPV